MLSSIRTVHSCKFRKELKWIFTILDSGLGNYDVTVLELAANQLGFEIKWFDKRKILTEKDLATPGLLGFIVNAKTFFGRHWFTLRSFDNTWYNLDSKLENPAAFESSTAVCELINFTLRNAGELLMVYNKESTWVPNTLITWNHWNKLCNCGRSSALHHRPWKCTQHIGQKEKRNFTIHEAFLDLNHKAYC